MAAMGLWLQTADLRRRRPAALVEGPVDLLQVAEGFVFAVAEVFRHLRCVIYVLIAALFTCSALIT